MTEKLNTVMIREALEEADRYGWVSPEWQYIRYLIARVDDDDSYAKPYRAGWSDALAAVRSFVEDQDSA